MKALSFLPLCPWVAAMFPSQGKLLTLWICKPAYTSSSVSCFGHGILSQQQGRPPLISQWHCLHWKVPPFSSDLILSRPNLWTTRSQLTRISAVWRILSVSLPDFMWLLLPHMVKRHCHLDGSWSDLGTFLWVGSWKCCQMSLEGPWMCMSWRPGLKEGRWWVELLFSASWLWMQ